MNTARRVAKNTVSLLISGLFAQLLGFFAIVYLARVLGPDFFGEVNFAFAIYSYFVLSSNLGLPLLGTREIARNKENLASYVSGIISIRLLLSVISFVLLACTALIFIKISNVRPLLLIYGFGVFSSAFLVEWVFQGTEQMERIGLCRVLNGLTYFVLSICFVHGPEQLLLVPVFHVFAISVSAITGVYLFSKDFGVRNLRVVQYPPLHLLYSALPFGASILMVQVIHNIDTVMLGFMRSELDVGYYNAAYRIIFCLIMFGAAYFDSIYPVISKSYRENSLDYLEKVQSYSSWLVGLITMPVAVGGFILARPLIQMVYGVDYDRGTIAFQYLVWSIVLWAVNNVYVRGLLGCDREKNFIAVLVVQSTINVLLNLILIPGFGLQGAAVATLASELVGLFLYARESRKIISISVEPNLIKPLFASIPMAIVLYWLTHYTKISLFFMIGIGMICYFFIIFLIKGITKENILILKQVFYDMCSSKA